MGDPVVSQAVEVGVAAGVVGLADVADYSRDGGEEDEEIEVFGEEGVQVEGAADFGREDGVEGGVWH